MSRGRGRGQLTFNAELLGVGRGHGMDAAPASVLKPPAKYPPRPGRIPPLLEGPDQDYLLAAQKQFLAGMRSSRFYTDSAEGKEEAEGTGYCIDRLAAPKTKSGTDPLAALNLRWDR